MADTTDNQTQDEWNEETVYGPSTVIAALDQIEDLVESSRTVPLSASIMINKAELLDLLDQAREALPEDLVAADAVVADADADLGRADSALPRRTRARPPPSTRPTSAPRRSWPMRRKKRSARVRAPRMRRPLWSLRHVRMPRPRSPMQTHRLRASSLPRISCAWLRTARVRSSPRRSDRQLRCARVPMTTSRTPSMSSPTSSPIWRAARMLAVARLPSVAASTSPMWT